MRSKYPEIGRLYEDFERTIGDLLWGRARRARENLIRSICEIVCPECKNKLLSRRRDAIQDKGGQ